MTHSKWRWAPVAAQHCTATLLYRKHSVCMAVSRTFLLLPGCAVQPDADRYIHLHALLLPHNPAWDIPFPTPEYLHSSSWVQNPQDCISESRTELTLPARPIYSSPPTRLPRTTACFLYFIKANRWCSSVEKHLWKGRKERQEFGSGRRSIFILHLQLLVHVYISICTPIFIKT